MIWGCFGSNAKGLLHLGIHWNQGWWLWTSLNIWSPEPSGCVVRQFAFHATDRRNQGLLNTSCRWLCVAVDMDDLSWRVVCSSMFLCVTFARTLSRHWLPPPRAIVLAFYLWLGAFTSFRWITKHDLSELFWVPQYPQWEVKNEQRASKMGKGPTRSNSELSLILVWFSGKAKIIGGTDCIRLSESRCPNGALSGYNQHFFQAWHDLDLYAAFCQFQ